MYKRTYINVYTHTHLSFLIYHYLLTTFPNYDASNGKVTVQYILVSLVMIPENTPTPFWRENPYSKMSSNSLKIFCLPPPFYRYLLTTFQNYDKCVEDVEGSLMDCLLHCPSLLCFLIDDRDDSRRKTFRFISVRSKEDTSGFNILNK